MDDTSRGLGDDAIEGRGEDSTRSYAAGDSTTPAPRAASTGRSKSPRPGTAARTAPAAGSTETPFPAAEAVDPQTDRRTRELRAEIEQTREEMSETIEAIQEKLRPGNVVAEATERVKNATTERVRNMVGSASQSAQGAMEQTRHMAGDVIEGARSNAIPAAMIGIGAAWLLIDRLRSRNRRYEASGDARRYASRRNLSGYYDSDEYRRSESWGPQYGQSGYAEYGTGPHGFEGRYDEQEGGLSETVSRAASRAGDAASQARAAAMRSGRRATNQFQRLLQENPLMVGAAAMVVGAAVGMALPETERENEWMGEAKESVIDRAQDVARDAASRVQEAAGEVAGQVASQVVGGQKDTNR